jgi:hypothetical protein
MAKRTRISDSTMPVPAKHKRIPTVLTAQPLQDDAIQCDRFAPLLGGTGRRSCERIATPWSIPDAVVSILSDAPGESDKRAPGCRRGLLCPVKERGAHKATLPLSMQSGQQASVAPIGVMQRRDPRCGRHSSWCKRAVDGRPRGRRSAASAPPA